MPRVADTSLVIHGTSAGLSSNPSLAQRLDDALPAGAPLFINGERLSRTADNLAFVALWCVIRGRNSADQLFDCMGERCGLNTINPRARARVAIRRLRSDWYIR